MKTAMLSVLLAAVTGFACGEEAKTPVSAKAEVVEDKQPEKPKASRAPDTAADQKASDELTERIVKLVTPLQGNPWGGWKTGTEVVRLPRDRPSPPSL